MKDGQGRQIDYLRISLTDRCNLRCIYCMPEHGVKSIPHESVLTLEGVHKAIECASQLGIKHIRFTGGEPTVRKGLLSLIERTAQTPGIESVALTTNAILLPGMAADLKAAGLSRVNISLDTLDTEQYRFITRLGNLDDALKGIEAALSRQAQYGCRPQFKPRSSFFCPLNGRCPLTCSFHRIHAYRKR